MQPAASAHPWLRWLHRLEDGLLACLLGSMILLACTQIVLRNLFDSGFTWADPLLRVMVLWLGMLGALAASRGNRHIVIDILSPVLPEAAKRWTSLITNLFTAVVCAAVAWYAGQFVLSELEYGGRGAANLPTALLASIVPFAFALMPLRFTLQAILPTARPDTSLEQE